jgi:hypothetical protein
VVVGAAAVRACDKNEHNFFYAKKLPITPTAT